MTVPIEPSAPERSWRWHLDRAAAVLLVVLLPLHLIAALVVGDPAAWSVARLAVRWNSPAWRALDWLTISVALLHGLGATRARFGAGDRRAAVRVVCDVVLVVGLLVAADAAFTWRID